MKIVDTNVLIYAVNEDARHHAASRAWLDRSLAGGDVVGLTWVALLAFLRLTTRPEIFDTPLSVTAAAEQIRAWIAAPGAVLVQPGEAHAGYLLELLEPIGVGGNLVNDAHLGALAREHRAEIVSYDSDFDQFEGIRRHVPEDLSTARD